MRRNGPDLANILDACLTRMNAGTSIDELVNEFAATPEKAEELRVLLETIQAVVPDRENLRVPASAQRNSRQRFLSQAQKLQQQPGATSLKVWLRFLRFLQHHSGSIAFAMTAILLLFIAFGSTKALPGDGLYPVKLVAERAGISLSGSTAVREERVSVYDTRRAEEVAAMIRMKRSGAIRFGGFLSSTKDKRWQVAGINLKLSTDADQQARTLTGAYVEIKGFLENNGVVRVDTLEPRLETVQGTITSIGTGQWSVGSQLVVITTNTRVSGIPRVGSQVAIQGTPLVNSSQVLAISVEVGNQSANESASATATVSPTVTVTAAVKPAIIDEPTETAQPTINAKPIQLKTPQAQSTDQPGQATSEPEDHHDQNNLPGNPNGDHSSGDQ